MASKFRLGTPLVKIIHSFLSYSAIQPTNKVINATKNITSLTEVKNEHRKTKNSHNNFPDKLAENLGHYETGGIWQILVDSLGSDRLRLIYL